MSDDPVAEQTSDAPVPSPGDTGGGVGDQPPGEDSPAGGGAPSKKKKQRSFLGELPFLIVIALVLALLIKTFLVQAFYIPSASMEPTLWGGKYLGVNHPFDRVLVNKLVYRFRDPHRGEIVVFRKPSYWNEEPTTTTSTGIVHFFQTLESDVGIPVNNTEDIIKRVIGVPGDVVRCQTSSSVTGLPGSTQGSSGSTQGSSGSTQGSSGNAQGYGGTVLTVNGHPLSEPYLYPGSSECGSPFTVTVAPGHLWVMGDNRNDSSDSRANPDNPWHGAIPISNVVGRAFAVIWPPSDWKGLGVPPTFSQPGLASQIATSPPVLGVLGAVPITVIRRRRRLRGRPSLVRRLLRRS